MQLVPPLTLLPLLLLLLMVVPYTRIYFITVSAGHIHHFITHTSRVGVSRFPSDHLWLVGDLLVLGSDRSSELIFVWRRCWAHAYFIHPLIDLFIGLSIYQSKPIYRPSDLAMYRSIDRPINLWIYRSINWPIYRPSNLSIYPWVQISYITIWIMIMRY